VLKARQSAAHEQWVFPSSRSQSGHYSEPKTAWGKIVDAAKLPGVRLHDLRRTFGSWQAANNTSELVIGKSLGHAPGSDATAIYARLHLNEVRDAVEAATEAILKASKKNPRKH
jgi:integrase